MTANVRIHDLPAHERPRERLAAEGAANLSASQLIAILLRTGLKGMSAIHVAEQLLKEFGTFENLARASLEDLRRIKGVGHDKAVTLKAAFELAKRLAGEARQNAPLLDTPEQIADLFREEHRLNSVETFRAILLNTRRRLIGQHEISRGTIDTLLVHPREVFKAAIAANAAAIILLHNHPSGDPTPSDADIKVTRDLIRAGQLLKIEVLDHIILGHATSERTKDWASLRELGYFHS